MKGGMEAIYDDIVKPIGFLKFAPAVPARGGMFGAAHRMKQQDALAPVLAESDLYSDPNK
jgi:hypothetical protein